MLRMKNQLSDLRGKYRKTFEVSLILALSFLIMAFKFWPEMQKQEVEFDTPQELFTVEDILQTNHENKPPPPPKPVIPVEAPSDNLLEDIELSATEIDEDVDEPLPPAMNENRTVVEEEPAIFRAVEEMPEPIGGIGEIQKKIIYPEIAKRAETEGRVYIKAVINEIGDVTQVEVLKGIGSGCDEAAMEAVRQTKFKPGKQRGKPVKVQITVPVFFKLR